MKSIKFENEKRELEKAGYKHKGGYVACPGVGGDHDLELWEHAKKEDPIQVCQFCETIR